MESNKIELLDIYLECIIKPIKIEIKKTKIKVNQKNVLEEPIVENHPFSESKSLLEIISALAKKTKPQTNLDELMDYEKEATKPLFEQLANFIKNESNTSNITRCFETIDTVKKQINEKISNINIKRISEHLEPQIKLTKNS